MTLPSNEKCKKCQSSCGCCCICENGIQAAVDHITNKADGAVVMQQGSSDGLIAILLADGWKLEAEEDHVAGKRIRYLIAPENEASD